MKTLDEVREYLDNIPYINSGGCGIAAYAMYLWLKKHNQLDKSFKFVFFYREVRDTEDYFLNRAILKKKINDTPLAPAHACIYHNKVYLDTAGEADLDEFDIIQHIKAEWFITQCLCNTRTWNNMFDRDIYIPRIEKKLGINLNL